MNCKKILIITIVLCSKLILGQIFIMDKESNSPLSFVEISSENKIIGYSDSNGKFMFPNDQVFRDTIYFRHTEYKIGNYIGNITLLKNIFLEKRSIDLNEVNVKPLLNKELISIDHKKDSKFSFNYGIYYVNLLKTNYDLFSIESIEYSVLGKLKSIGAVELTFYEYKQNEPGIEIEDYRQIIYSNEIKKGKLKFELEKPLIVRDKNIYIGIRLIDKIGLPIGKTEPSGLEFKFIDEPNINWWIKPTNSTDNKTWIKWDKKNALIGMQPKWNIIIKH